MNHCDEGSDIPAVGDVMVQLGDVSDTDFRLQSCCLHTETVRLLLPSIRG